MLFFFFCPHYYLCSWLYGLEVCHKQGRIVLVLCRIAFKFAFIIPILCCVAFGKFEGFVKENTWKYATWIKSEFKSRLILSSKSCSPASVDSVGFNWYLTELNVLISSFRLRHMWDETSHVMLLPRCIKLFLLRLSNSTCMCLCILGAFRVYCRLQNGGVVFLLGCVTLCWTLGLLVTFWCCSRYID